MQLETFPLIKIYTSNIVRNKFNYDPFSAFSSNELILNLRVNLYRILYKNVLENNRRKIPQNQ